MVSLVGRAQLVGLVLESVGSAAVGSRLDLCEWRHARSDRKLDPVSRCLRYGFARPIADGVLLELGYVLKGQPLWLMHSRQAARQLVLA